MSRWWASPSVRSWIQAPEDVYRASEWRPSVPFSRQSPLLEAATIYPQILADDFSGQRRTGPLPAIGAFDYHEVD